MNEVLAKVLCHNICVLIQAMFEFGVEPSWVRQQGFESESLVDAKPDYSNQKTINLEVK